MNDRFIRNSFDCTYLILLFGFPSIIIILGCTYFNPNKSVPIALLFFFIAMVFTGFSNIILIIIHKKFIQPRNVLLPLNHTFILYNTNDNQNII
jgi:hypothetical protein